MTKTSWVKAMFYPDTPTFPLDAEALASVPDDLPGDLPKDPIDLLLI